MLEDYIRANFQVVEVRRSGELRINCPFCDDDHHHGYINVLRNVYHCFRCQKGLHAVAFLIKGAGLPYQEAKETVFGTEQGLERYLHFDRKEDFEKAMEDLEVEIVKPYTMPEEYPVSLPEFWPLKRNTRSAVRNAAWDYIERRIGRLQTEYWNEVLGFGVCTRGPFSGRIILPVWDSPGKCTYFQARAFMPASAKPTYINPPVPRPLFFPQGYFDDDRSRHMFLVEGYFDALAVGEGCAAMFGSELSPRQVEHIQDIKPDIVTVCLDPDKAGIKGSISVCRDLFSTVKKLYVVPPGLGGDPAYLGPMAKKLILENRRPWSAALMLDLELWDLGSKH